MFQGNREISEDKNEDCKNFHGGKYKKKSGLDPDFFCHEDLNTSLIWQLPI
jgi:hypothetical protein